MPFENAVEHVGVRSLRPLRADLALHARKDGRIISPLVEDAHDFTDTIPHTAENCAGTNKNRSEKGDRPNFPDLTLQIRIENPNLQP